MSARLALRAGTAADHERVDRLFSRLDLARPDHYRLFLTAQAAAHLPIEAALDAAGASRLLADWKERRRRELLIADLEALGVTIPAPAQAPQLRSSEAILGAIYVLEGSRLGAAVLSRRLSPDAPRRFLTARQQPGAWRKLLEKLDESLYQPALAEGAIESARQVFMRFEAAGRLYLECKAA